MIYKLKIKHKKYNTSITNILCYVRSLLCCCRSEYTLFRIYYEIKFKMFNRILTTLYFRNKNKIHYMRQNNNVAYALGHCSYVNGKQKCLKKLFPFCA